MSSTTAVTPRSANTSSISPATDSMLALNASTSIKSIRENGSGASVGAVGAVGAVAVGAVGAVGTGAGVGAGVMRSAVTVH